MAELKIKINLYKKGKLSVDESISLTNEIEDVCKKHKYKKVDLMWESNGKTKTFN